MTELLTAYKCTRADGTDFRTGTVNYRDHLHSGEPLVHPDPEPPKAAHTGDTCGRGYHVSPTAKLATTFGIHAHRPFAWFEVLYAPCDEVERDAKKIRLRCIRKVVRELSITDVLGVDFYDRVARVKQELLTWTSIPWLKPSEPVPQAKLEALFQQWHGAMTPWLKPGLLLSPQLQVVTSAAADAAAAAADAAADAAVAAVAAAAAAVAAVAAAAADADADAAADADADAAAAAAAADAAAAAAAVAAAVAAARANWCRRWYVRPYWVLRQRIRWQLAGMEQPNPWAPLVEIYKLGCMPIGYSGGKFVVYAPDLNRNQQAG